MAESRQERREMQGREHPAAAAILDHANRFGGSQATLRLEDAVVGHRRVEKRAVVATPDFPGYRAEFFTTLVKKGAGNMVPSSGFKILARIHHKSLTRPIVFRPDGSLDVNIKDISRHSKIIDEVRTALKSLEDLQEDEKNRKEIEAAEAVSEIVRSIAPRSGFKPKRRRWF